jgi:DNA mismatch endonuclease (patch repair protein)
MSRIRSRDTKPEMLVRKFLFSKGYRYRLYDKKLPGKPDIVLPKYKTVIFIHGCFWHRHENCPFATIPKTNFDWWNAKLNLNRQRDMLVMEKISAMGWRVLVIWGCNLKPQNRLQSLGALVNQLCS